MQTLSTALTAINRLAMRSDHRQDCCNPASAAAICAAASGERLQPIAASRIPIIRLTPIKLRTAQNSALRSPAPRRLDTCWMMASPKPEAMMPPVLTAAVATAHTPKCATPRLRNTTGATTSMPNG